MNCKICNKILKKGSKTGYCKICFETTKEYLDYQRVKQNEWYSKPENKKKRRRYYNKPEIKKRTKQYNKEYYLNVIKPARKLNRDKND